MERSSAADARHRLDQLGGDPVAGVERAPARSADVEPLPPAAAQPARFASVGISLSQSCGVRDHAALLADALAAESGSQALHWLWRNAHGWRRERAEIRAWSAQLPALLEHDRPDAIVLHYTVFAYSYRGVPVFVAPVLAPLRATRLPIITIAHELAYPWKFGGWRGKGWWLTQRAALIEVVRASAALVATAEFRAQWLRSRRWLPKREVRVAPVFSNLPPSFARPDPERGRKRLGMFGYAYQGLDDETVLDALRLLRERGLDVEFVLLGAPGGASPSAEKWRDAARARGIAELLSFDGPLPAQALADALAGCDVLVFADASGPSSRKGSLAAALASGRPVVAFDGHLRWSDLVQSRALEVVAPNAGALAGALAELLADEPRRESLGARGRAFAEQQMGVARTARTVEALLGGVRAGCPA